MVMLGVNRKLRQAAAFRPSREARSSAVRIASLACRFRTLIHRRLDERSVSSTQSRVTQPEPSPGADTQRHVVANPSGVHAEISVMCVSARSEIATTGS
jgi:hypothetical protein